MLEKILPAEITEVIRARLDEARVYELRLRCDRPVTINYGGRYYFLCRKGLSDMPENAIVASSDAVRNAVVRATEFSLYAVNNQLARGFITIAGGVRLGICGEVVRGSDGEVRTIKDFSSVNIRVPHEVPDCALTAVTYMCDLGRPASALIAAPPGAGKTTVLRDLCRQLCARKSGNILLVDERCEIAAVCDGRPGLDVGECTDVISNCSKEYAFSYGIRSMRPDVIVTDELMRESDFEAVRNAAAGGVCVVASVHASCPKELFARINMRPIMENKIFSRYIFLSERSGPGTYENIYDADMKCIRFAG